MHTRALSRIGFSAALVMMLMTTSAIAETALPVRFDHLSLEEGLSQVTVLNIFQDSRGFVWLGTEDGLNRYDGLGFKVYKHDPADPDSLPSNFVWAIDEDSSGNLWIGTDGGGVAMLDRATDRFVRHTEISSQFIRSLRFGADGDLWIGTRDSGLDRMDTASGRVTSFDHDEADSESLSDDRIFTLHFDSQGRLWIGTDGGVNLFDAKNDRFTHFAHEPGNPSSLSDGRVRSIFEDQAGAIWIGTRAGGLNRLDPPTGVVEQFRHDPDVKSSLSHDRVRSIFEDAQGRLWVGTSNGLDMFDRRTERFLHYEHDATNPTSLADNCVMSIDQDRGGVLWVGTRFGGVHKFNPASWQFGHVPPDPENPVGLRSGHVMAFSEDRAGRLWIGTVGGGLHAMNRVTGEMTRYQYDPDDSGSLSSDRVSALRHDHRGALWIGTIDAGLNRFEPANGSFKNFRHDPEEPQSLSADGVMALLEDRQGTLWVGTFGGGLNQLDTDGDTFTQYRHDPEDSESIGGDRVTCLAEAPDGRLWIGTDGGGLSLLDVRTRKAVRFTNDVGDPRSLPSNSLYSLFVDPAGDLWVGTRSGLAHKSADGDGFETISSKQGLPNDVIYGILPDQQGRLWLSTNNGVARFDPRSDKSLNFGVRHGLQGSEFNFGAAYHSPSGEMFFGGLNGFNAFFPDRLRLNEQAPPVVLTSVRKGNEPIDGPADEIKAIEMNYRDSTLTFEFAALDFTDSERNSFAYRLEGFDEEWIDLGHVRRTTYTNLDPGDYTFRVRAANSDGAWNTEGLAVDIHVPSPPWESPWAYASYCFALFGGLIGFVEVQRRKTAREAEYARVLELKVQERTRELAERQHELEHTNEMLAKVSITDALTGLANRRYLNEYIEKEVQLVHRRYRGLEDGSLTHKSFDMAFVMIDLDNFKTINDTAGHAAGDAVLRQMSAVLEDSCRNSDIVIRWGGDEFLIVARDLNSDSLGVLVERIRQKMQNHAFDTGDGQVVRTTCSIGFASYPFHPTDIGAFSWEQVISVADQALYVAKTNGRNAWVGFSCNPETPIHNLLGNIRHAPRRLLDEGHITLTTSLEGDVSVDED